MAKDFTPSDVEIFAKEVSFKHTRAFEKIFIVYDDGKEKKREKRKILGACPLVMSLNGIEKFQTSSEKRYFKP